MARRKVPLTYANELLEWQRSDPATRGIAPKHPNDNGRGPKPRREATTEQVRKASVRDTGSRIKRRDRMKFDRDVEIVNRKRGR
jgi:hypothetical protein